MVGANLTNVQCKAIRNVTMNQLMYANNIFLKDRKYKGLQNWYLGSNIYGSYLT
jgi:hypothetical protein